MGITFQFQDGTLEFTTTGDVAYRDGLEVLKAGFNAIRQAKNPVRWNLLFDITRSEENRQSNEIRGVAELIAENKDILTGRCVVVADAPLHYGLARMFGAFLENLGLKSHVTTTIAEARAWLAQPTC